MVTSLWRETPSLAPHPISFWSIGPLKMLWIQHGGRVQEHQFVPCGFETLSHLAPPYGATEDGPTSTFCLGSPNPRPPPLGLGTWALRYGVEFRSSHQGMHGGGDPWSGHKVPGDTVLATLIQSLHSGVQGWISGLHEGRGQCIWPRPRGLWCIPVSPGVK